MRMPTLLTIWFAWFASYAMADSAFDGKWTAEVVRPAPATTQNLTITITTTGGKVSGTIAIAGGGETPIEWGITKGDLITFRVKLPFNDTMANFVHLGRLDGDKLILGRRPEDLSLGRLVEFTAQRAK